MQEYRQNKRDTKTKNITVEKSSSKMRDEHGMTKNPHSSIHPSWVRVGTASKQTQSPKRRCGGFTGLQRKKIHNSLSLPDWLNKKKILMLVLNRRYSSLDFGVLKKIGMRDHDAMKIAKMDTVVMK